MQSRTALVVLTIAMCAALAQDVSCLNIAIPPAVIDSNTTFDPMIFIQNNSSESLPNVPVGFNIVRTSDPTDTFYSGTANSGPVRSGRYVFVPFNGANLTPRPGHYTMTGITELPGDTNPHNDTCTKSLFVRYIDVRTEIVSPRDTETPGLIAVQVRLTNNGNGPALVSRLDVKITAGYYPDYRENITIGVGEQQDVMWNPWSYTGGTETCTAWITYPADMNHSNDTDVVVLSPGGISGREELEPNNGMRLTFSPSPLAGNVLRIEYSLNQAGPADVTLFDITGRPVATRRFVADRAGELPLDLRRLSGGVYLVRLDDGRQGVAQKLVVQR